ncbi:MAG: lamin tail domain-containing protein [Patescibacteria group bacterium]
MNIQKNNFKIIIGLIIFLSLTHISFGQETGVQLRFNEIMYDPSGDDLGQEWVELFNYGKTEIEIIGGRAKNSWIFIDSNGPHFLAEKPLLGSLIIKPGEFLILASNAETFLKTYPNFTGTVIDTIMDLNNFYGFIQLKTGNNQLLDQAFWSSNLGAAGNNKTLEYVKNIFRESLREFGSPGQENSVENIILPPAPSLIVSPSPAPQPKPSPKPTAPASSDTKAKIIINEIFANPGKNNHQWLEIKNQDNKEISLNQWKIIVGSTGQEIILDKTVKPNAYLVIELIQLDKNKETIQLINSENKKVFEVKYSSPVPINWSAIRLDNGAWKLTVKPTPGQENIYFLPEAVAEDFVPQELIPAAVFENNNLQAETKAKLKPKLSLAGLIFSGLGIGLSLTSAFVLLRKKLIL